MSTILAYTSPARGHLYPLTSILLELQARGHDICVRTLSSEVDAMRDLGFQAEPVDPAVESIALHDWQHRSQPKALAASVQTFVDRARFDASDLERAIAQEAPVAVIVDINSWGALAAAEKWGGPWAAFCPYPIPLPSSETPPYGPGFAPAHNALGRIRDAAARPLVEGAMNRSMLPGVNDVRDSQGLPAIDRLSDQFRRPPLLLYLTAEPFEYHRTEWPDSVVMVGPCTWEPPAAGPAWLGETPDPLIVVTTSSEFQDDGRLAQTVMDALAGQQVQVVATVPAGDPAAFRVPENARVVQYVPHGPLFTRADVVITHGGMGATQKALSLGVPVVAVPFGRDQLEVARRVEMAGAGVRLPSKHLSGSRIVAAVREARGMVAGAQRVAQGFRDAGGPVAAADAVEARLIGVSSDL
ncbi:MAG TPA: glycosyltransferase [Actinomycetota bacterium]|nr:glycosyltransferase [Actinomycetota bacterium]HNL51692.1 glycosyltransferase [Actinomycetota bacterium]